MSNVQNHSDYGAFIPSSLDDYGLNVYEYRIYCRIVRRASSGKCFESVQKMSDGCKMTVKKVRDALFVLLKLGMIAVVDAAPGKKKTYIVTHHGKWADPRELDDIRAEVLSPRKDDRKRLVINPDKTPTGSNTPTGSEPPLDPIHTPIGSNLPTPIGSNLEPRLDPTPEGIQVRYSLKGSPSKEENTGQKTQKEEHIDPEATQYDACQSKTQTDQLPTQNNSLDETNYSAAAPQNEVSSGLTYLHPAQRANDRFQQRGANIPEWRIGWGPNDWNEQILGWWVKWLDKKWDGQHSRADAISYIVKRERPDHAEYPTLIARLEEVKQFGQRLESASQKQRSQAVVEPEELATPDQVKQFSELAQQMQRQRMLKSAKGA